MCDFYIENCHCTKCGREFSRQVQQSEAPKYVLHVPFCDVCQPPKLIRVQIVHVYSDKTSRVVGEGWNLHAAKEDMDRKAAIANSDRSWGLRDERPPAV